MTRDPESRLPVLLMELLDESLTKMLKRSQQPLAYYVQVDICHDIALAVTYLHSNDIVHRDLSSNNVLMIAGRRAKVTDFGMSKLVGATPSQTPLTMCPGTPAYMSPEALREPPRYTKKLDCFSEGVIMIQVCTRLWPEPGPRTQVVEDSHSPMGVIEVPVSEIERRKNHIDLMDASHALLPIARDCLQFQDKDRPSSEELCQRLADLKETREYRESTQMSDNEKVIILIRQLQEKDHLLSERDNEILLKGLEIQDRDRDLQQMEIQLGEEISSQKRQLRQLNQQLEEQEEITADIQQTNNCLQRQVEQLQQQLSQQSLESPQPPPPTQAQIEGRQLQERESLEQLPVQPPPQVDHRPHLHRVKKMTLNWREEGKAPFEMSRGAAVVGGNMVYFMNCGGEVCSYNSTTKGWSIIQKCPYEYSSLAVVNGQLTAIGGCKDWCNEDTYTNKLLSLYDGWKEVFPPMPTKRQSTTAVTSKEHLIVAGGKTGVWSYHCTCIRTVEVMALKNLIWSTVTNLPHPYTRASGTICGDQLYVLGGWDDERMTNSVLICSLVKLLRSSAWYRDVDAPLYSSTCAAVNGELLAVGGCDNDGKPSTAIHKYNLTTNSWDLISNMPTARYYCLVVVLPTNEMMVVGGRDQDRIEIASITIS